MKNLIYKILKVLSVIFFTLLTIEIIIRILHLAPIIPKGKDLFMQNKYLPYMTRPYLNSNVELENKEFTFLCKHNSAGLRDVEHILKKPKGVFRILGLGDSFTYGFGASFEDTYLYKLEEMLDKRKGNHLKIEIIKGGIPASYPETQRIFLEHYGKEYQPDIIIVGFLPNDVVNTYLGKNYFKVTPDGYLLVFNHSAIYKFGRFLYFTSHLWRIILKKIYWPLITNTFEHWSDIYKKDGFLEKSWLKIEEEYSKMLDISKSMGAKLVIVHIPEKDLPTKISDRIYPVSRLSNWCKIHGAFFIDTLSELQKNGNLTGFYWKDGHCNPEGYRIIAETIFNKLLEFRLTP